MINKKWQSRLLAMVLSAELVVPSFSVTAFASETDLTVLAEETGQAVVEESDSVVVDESFSTENEMDAVSETQIVPEEDTELEAMEETTSSLGYFEDVTMDFEGFHVAVDGIFQYSGNKSGEYVSVRLVQYDDSGNRLCSTEVWSLSDTYSEAVEIQYSGILVHDKAAYLCLEAGDGTNKSVSQNFQPMPRPQVEYKVEMANVGAGSVTYIYECEGLENYDNHFEPNIVLNYGANEDSSTWQEIHNSYLSTSWPGYSGMVIINGLNQNETVYGELIFYLECMDKETEDWIRCYETRVAIPAFTTLENEVYQMEEVFPDETLRRYISRNIAGYELETVTSAQLESISYLTLYRNSFEDATIRDLSGIDLLKNLRELDVRNHEISDISRINWDNLSVLYNLYLGGNEITKVPDLTKNNCLKLVDFSENLLGEEERKNISEKLPANAYDISVRTENQRTDNFGLKMEECYYVYPTGTNIFVEPVRYKNGLPYTVKFYLDGEEIAFCKEEEEYYGNMYSLMNAELAEGKYTLKAELYQEDTKINETEEYEFTVVNEDFFSVGLPIYAGADTRDYDGWDVRIGMTSGNSEIESVELVNSSGKVYGIGEDIYEYTTSSDPRYEIFQNGYPTNGDMNLRMLFITMRAMYNTVPEGNYALKLTFADGTTKQIDNAMIFMPKTDMVINYCIYAYEYDNTGDYLYFQIRGNNVKPEQLSYQIVQNGIEYPVTYVNCKPIYDSYIVKLKKEGWRTLPSNRDQSTIIVSGGTEASTWEKELDNDIHHGVHYIKYNRVKNTVLMAVTQDVAETEKTIKASLRYDYSSEAPVLAQAEATIENGLAELKFVQADGSEYLFQNGEYYIDYEIGSIKEYRSISVYGIYNVKAMETTNSENETWIVNAESNVTMDQEMSEGIIADASTAVTKQNDPVLEVAAKDKFIITNLSTNWDTESEILVYLSSPTVKSDDKYTVTIKDYQGNPIEGVTIKTKHSYNGGATFSIKGLNYEDAAKFYYIKVVHKTLGEAYEFDGITPYFANENGKFLRVYYNDGMSYVSNQGRMVGISLRNRKLPATISIYEPYDTEVLQEVTIKQSTQLINGWYFFTKEFTDGIPQRDMIYDIILNLGDGRTVFSQDIIDCEENLLTKWSYIVDKTVLSTNVEENKTAVVQVIDNTGKPTFKTSDSNIVSIKVDENNPNKAILTAMGIGTAQISITVDGATRKFTVVCERKVILESLALNQSEMTLVVGEAKKLFANVFPAEAWKDDMEVNFSIDNSEVLSLVQDSNNSVSLKAVAPGQAVVTASLVGTDLTAQCAVTVENSFSTDEKNTLIRDVGTLYVLANETVALKDVQLPAGWSWVEPEKNLKADNNLPIQLYSAQYKTEGYQAFTAVLPVAVSALSKVQIVGEAVLDVTETKTYQAKGIFIGYQPTGNEFTATLGYVWDIDNMEVVAETSAESDRFVVTTKEVEKNTSAKVMLSVSIGGKEYKAELPITVTANPYVDKIALSVSDNQLDTKVKDYSYSEEGELPEIKVDNRVISTKKNEVSNTLRVYASAYAKENFLELAKGFKWTSSDASVVAIKQENNGQEAILTFKKPGSAVLYITSTDEGKFQQEVLISVIDYAPILENDKISLDLYAKAGTHIPVKAQNGNNINSVVVEEQDSATKEWVTSTKFELDGLLLKAKESYVPSKNEKVNVQFRFATEKDEFEKTATINVNVKTKPTVSFKTDSKANLFYTDAEAFYVLSSKYEIESIEDITVKDGESYRGRMDEEGFRLNVTDLNNALVSFSTGNTLTAETLEAFKAKNSPLCEVTLKINFKGYTDAADQIVTVKVATENKKPSMKLNDVTILYGQNNTNTQVYDTKAKSVVYLEEGMNIASKTTGIELIATDSGEVKVYYGVQKGTTYKAELTSENWTQPVDLKGKITVNDTLKQKVILETSKVTLNTAHSIQKNGKLAVGISIDNNTTPIEKLFYEVDKKNGALFNQGYLSITFNKNTQQFYIGLNEGMGEGIKPGTYKVYLIGKVKLGETEQELKPVLLTIVLTDKAPAVSLKASGNVDLVRRYSTDISYTPSYKNVTAKANKVVLSGAYADYFTGMVAGNGTVHILAKEGYPMSAKVTYPLTVTLVLDNGCEVSSTVNIKPVSKLPKVKVENATQNIYKSNAQVVSYQLMNSDNSTEIEKVMLVEDKNSQYFDSAFLEGDVVTVALKDAKKVKPGKYTLKFNVYFEGAAYDVKPVTVKRTVVVK